jgi:diguanylate cyclase (GGDEF)-like protein
VPTSSLLLGADAPKAPPVAVLPAEVVLAFAEVPLTGTPEQVAHGCVEAVRRLAACRVALHVPTVPVPLAVGDVGPGMAALVTFPAPGGEGTLWAGSKAHALPAPAREALARELARVWEVQAERAATAGELDQLRFHLNALQQVARTLSVVRSADETVKMVLDSVGEVFFAWWAALYQTDGDVYTCRAVRSPRGSLVARAIPAEVVREVAAPGLPPVVPPQDAKIRDHVPAEVAVLAPLDLGEAGAGVLLLGRRLSDAPYQEHDLALLRALADSSAVAMRNAELLDRLRAQATLDPLTGCHNRRGFDEVLHAELARGHRYGRPLSLVFLDIDHFKRINDEFGHEVGDHALQRIGRVVRHTFRTTDSACRYGGEEFALVFPETPKVEAVRLAERLRDLVATLPPTAEVPRTMTASFGVAAFPDDGTDAAALIRSADRALYQAKANGRNRVEVA